MTFERFGQILLACADQSGKAAAHAGEYPGHDTDGMAALQAV